MAKLFAIDLGNKQVKMMTKHGIKIFPSYFIDATEFGNRDLLKVAGEKTTFDYTSAREDDFTYVWGAGLRLRNKFVNDSIRFEGRYTSRDYKLLADFALAEMARSFKDAAGATIDVSLVTGAPTDDFNAKEASEQLGKALKGIHAVTIDGVNYVVNVVEVVALPQPLGTYVDNVIDEDGYIVEDSPLLDVLVGIVDLGGGTVIVDAIDDMNLQTGFHNQSFEGAYTLYERIQAALTQNGHKITVYEVEAFIRAGHEAEAYTWTPNNLSKHDFTDIVMTERKRYTRRIASMVLATYKDLSKFRTILVTGGTANLLVEEEFIAELPIAQFVKDSEIANVRGFYKYGLNAGMGKE